mmetsp:Transcript_7504/g.33310  ORF Transcript_7504/g.33310 Transcript_7504/m.33310 type:complete len:97 (+) Transcript_7504:784-1074(+)
MFGLANVLRDSSNSDAFQGRGPGAEAGTVGAKAHAREEGLTIGRSLLTMIGVLVGQGTLGRLPQEEIMTLLGAEEEPGALHTMSADINATSGPRGP